MKVHTKLVPTLVKFGAFIRLENYLEVECSLHVLYLHVAQADRKCSATVYKTRALVAVLFIRSRLPPFPPLRASYPRVRCRKLVQVLVQVTKSAEAAALLAAESVRMVAGSRPGEAVPRATMTRLAGR